MKEKKFYISSTRRKFSVYRHFLSQNYLSIKWIIIGHISLYTVLSCSTDEFIIGSGFIESKTNITLIDTFQVEMSTILIDSFETSSDTVILAGNYFDTLIGSITCNSSFEIGIPTERNFEADDIFDSICLILKPNGYYFGDTLQPHAFTVHRLLSDLETYTDGYLYNTTTIDYEADAMGTFNWQPRPQGTDSIFVRLNNSFGEELFNIYMSDEYFSTTSEFLEYFKGIYIQSDTVLTENIIGFNASGVSMRMYMHRFDEYKENKTVDFHINNTNEQYNRIITNFNKSKYLSDIKENTNKLLATNSGNMSFMQCGTGLVQKILFPTLSEMLLIENGALLKAELELNPVKTSYLNLPLQKKLILYQTDKYNNFLDVVTGVDGYVVYSTLAYDEFYFENTSYTFDITQFINDQSDQKYFDPDRGLLLFPGSGNYNTNLDRLILSSGSETPKLNLYYVTYIE